jgi:hypothetical protein
MEDIKVTWVSDNITIEYPKGVVGLIRCMSIPLEFPAGGMEWACAVVINNNECTIKILNGIRGPTLTESKQLIKYFRSLGYTGGWDRFKTGKPPKTISIK